MHEPNRGCERLKTPSDVAVKADPAEKDLLPAGAQEISLELGYMRAKRCCARAVVGRLTICDKIISHEVERPPLRLRQHNNRLNRWTELIACDAFCYRKAFRKSVPIGKCRRTSRLISVRQVQIVNQSALSSPTDGHADSYLCPNNWDKSFTTRSLPYSEYRIFN